MYECCMQKHASPLMTSKGQRHFDAAASLSLFNMWYIPAVYSAYCRSIKGKVVLGHDLKGYGGVET